MIGQMLIVGFAGRTMRSRGARRIARLLGDGTIGGTILMRRNIASRRTMKSLTGFFHAATGDLPPLIGIDQEGGYVQRLGPRNGYRRYPSAARIARGGGPERARRIYGNLAAELAGLGINLNFGPVVDLNTNPRNPVIGRLRRSYSANPATVTRFARAFIAAHHAAGILTAAKHFPGHGSSWADSHKRFVDLTRSWQAKELAPYRALAKSGGPDMVMVGHLYHPRITGRTGDASRRRLPASLSRRAIEGELRTRLGFRGVVITDDLEMAAIRRHFGLRESVIRAIRAGNDILLFSNAAGDSHLANRLQAIIAKAVRDGRLTRTRIRRSFERIKALKRRLARLTRSAVRARSNRRTRSPGGARRSP